MINDEDKTFVNIFPLRHASCRFSYNKLRHGNAATTSIYDVVNEFLEAITTQKNEVP